MVLEIYGRVIEQLAGAGLIESMGDFIRVTEKGLNVVDAIAGEFLLE